MCHVLSFFFLTKMLICLFLTSVKCTYMYDVHNAGLWIPLYLVSLKRQLSETCL